MRCDVQEPNVASSFGPLLDRFGPLVKVALPTIPPFVLISRVDLIKQVFVSDFDATKRSVYVLWTRLVVATTHHSNAMPLSRVVQYPRGSTTVLWPYRLLSC
jgi:hypothetical protein